MVRCTKDRSPKLPDRGTQRRNSKIEFREEKARKAKNKENSRSSSNFGNPAPPKHHNTYVTSFTSKL
jgi:hypothetical protein